MSPQRKELAPVVKAILADVQCTSLGSIRIPKDKFMMWISILRKQHKGNDSVFLQLAILGVEFIRQKVSFVSDQFFILAAVGLDPARVGALIAPEDVETKVASMFVQKFQTNPTSFGTGAGAALAPASRQPLRQPSRLPHSDNHLQVELTKNASYYQSSTTATGTGIKPHNTTIPGRDNKR